MRVAPACLKTAIAGGLRRGKEEVHDIDLVVVPIPDASLFGDREPTHGLLIGALQRCLAEGLLTRHEETRPGTYHRFRVPRLDGMPLEIWFAECENWGDQLVIRTGSAEFSQACVKPVCWEGGLLPLNLLHKNGYLWRFESMVHAMAARRAKTAAESRLAMSSAQRLPCLTERDFFAYLRLPFIEPMERSKETVERLIHERGEGGRVKT